MIRSMTGYGKGECVLADHSKITVEIKTLNGKNADISIKSLLIPKDKELEIRKLLTKELVRGSIEISISNATKHTSARVQNLNKSAALSYIEQTHRIMAEYAREQDKKTKKSARRNASQEAGLDACITPLAEAFLWSSILRMPDIFEAKDFTLSDADCAKIDKAIIQAIKKLNTYRATEGKALCSDVTARIEKILALLQEVKKLDVKRIPAIKERLRQKIEKGGIAANPERLEQELVFYVEKLDINEEKVRLRQHCKYFMDTLNKEPLAGKKLGFIVQEIGREINTLGSKANDADIQALVVRMKDEVEKIKEQTLNIL